MEKRKNKGMLGILFLVFVFFIIFIMFAVNTVATLKGNKGFKSFASRSNEPIAVIEINGTIMTSKTIVEQLIDAEEDKTIKAIIVRVNSPGGAVGPTQEVYQEIERIDKKKPVYASFGSVAASGGYYVGAATRKIFANPGTLTGSIGVIMQFMDLSKLYEWAKLKPETVKAGLYKDIGSPAREMKPAERKLMNEMVASVHDQFKQDILAKRGDRIKGNADDHFQGQIFSGELARDYGLVDELLGLWGAGRYIHKELKIQEKFGLRFIKKKKKNNFLDLIEDLESSVSNIRQKVETVDMPQLFFLMQR